MATRIAVNGAAGRMGRRIIACATEDKSLSVTAALTIPGDPTLGQDAGVLSGVAPIGVLLSDKPLRGFDVLIDFSTPEGLLDRLPHCRATKTAVVVGTTGLKPEHHAALDAAASEIAILQSPNMSVGVNLLFRIAAEVAKTLGEEYDIEIVEAHHRLKADSPSGTALGLAEAICRATGRDMAKDLVHGRHGIVGARTPREIGMHAVRAGDTVGEHTVIYGAMGERIELRHSASTRDTFARGALRAARWLAGKPAGRYSMRDVLGL
jgi:4-hydroxy-tetrahydrodipicolinate reductase